VAGEPPAAPNLSDGHPTAGGLCRGMSRRGPAGREHRIAKVLRPPHEVHQCSCKFALMPKGPPKEPNPLLVQQRFSGVEGVIHEARKPPFDDEVVPSLREVLQDARRVSQRLRIHEGRFGGIGKAEKSVGVCHTPDADWGLEEAKGPAGLLNPVKPSTQDTAGPPFILQSEQSGVVRRI
jgi:hypothetical protein